MLDQINGAFEAGLAVMLFLNLRRLMQDREVKGFDYKVVVFTTAWGIWNLYYYPQLNQMFSFYAGIAVVLMNATWLGMLIYYNRTGPHENTSKVYFDINNPLRYSWEKPPKKNKPQTKKEFKELYGSTPVVMQDGSLGTLEEYAEVDRRNKCSTLTR